MIPTGRAQNAGRVAGVYTTVLPPFERFSSGFPSAPRPPESPGVSCPLRWVLHSPGSPGAHCLRGLSLPCPAARRLAPRARPMALQTRAPRSPQLGPRLSRTDRALRASRPPRGPLRLRVLCCPKLSPAEPPSRRAPEPHLRSASSLGARAIRLPVPSAPPRVGRPGSAPFTFPPPRHPINSTRLGLSVAPRLHCRPQRGGQGRPGITSEPTAFPRLLVECSVCYKCSACFIFLENRGEKNPAIH